MYAEERRQSIADAARRDGRVEVSALATALEVTAETVRRDLTDLERRGVLRRVHGGAIPVERFRAEPGVAEKSARMAAEKKRIAQAALTLVPPTGTILLDAGTTTAALAAVLPDRAGLTVVTNAAPIAMTLSARKQVRLLLIGGRVRGRTLANVDDWALRALADLRVDVAFVATNGVLPDRGLYTPDPSEAAVKRAIVAAGRRVVLLADRSKMHDEHLVRFAGLDDIDVFVTDDGIDRVDVAAIEHAGVEVVAA